MTVALSQISTQMQKLQQQKADIDRTLEGLQGQRNQALQDVFTLLPMSDINPEVLIGGLLFVLTEYRRDPAVAQRWQREGKKFLSTQKSNRVSSKNSASTQSKAAPTIQTSTTD